MFTNPRRRFSWCALRC